MLLTPLKPMFILPARSLLNSSVGVTGCKGQGVAPGAVIHILQVHKIEQLNSVLIQCSEQHSSFNSVQHTWFDSLLPPLFSCNILDTSYLCSALEL
jgi:hypothetical protein